MLNKPPVTLCFCVISTKPGQLPRMVTFRSLPAADHSVNLQKRRGWDAYIHVSGVATGQLVSVEA